MKYFISNYENQKLDSSSRKKMRGSFIQLSDGITHYELKGPNGGELVFLFGGLTIPLFYWDAITTELHDKGFRTLTYSGYGRGYSDRINEKYDLTLFVRQASDLIQCLGLDEVYHVVGASMGALIAMEFSKQHASFIKTLTFVGPAGLARPILSPDRILRYDLLANFLAKHFGTRLLEQHLGHNIRDPKDALILAKMTRDAYRIEGSMFALFSTLQNFRLSNRSDLYRGVKNLGIPIQLIWGKDDLVTPIHLMQEALHLLQPQSFQIIDCGHMVPFERPGQLAEHFNSFILSSQKGISHGK
ncbi:alpha/beta fold hydrolase [Leptospira andrefontaineae]|uniref:Alpha/beta hydrolase n=1 Tax=Leptospira andrefontaineae TaxID=2484976 RepID=A0A4R9GZ30_9LEPT|nr:alpha/beta hydrolase [Leptospira andrefontaineae]TGK36652.1 alpha/beta hydrolase [Leptospira andrefontaineae]